MNGAVTKTGDVPAHLQQSASNSSVRTRPTTWTLLAYSGLALPWCLAGLPILVYLPAFYAKELHLGAGLVGAVFLGARLWDGLSDVLVGWLSDRTKSRFGRRKPWVLIGAPFLMASTWFLCNPPPGAGLLYLGVCAALFYTAATVVGIPYLSWGTELATEYVERSRVTAFREAFNMLGNLFFAAAPLLLLQADAPLKDVLLLIAIAVLWLVPLTAVPLSLSVQDPQPTHRDKSLLVGALRALAKDRVFVRFVIMTLCCWVSNGVSNSLAVFSLTVGLQLPNKLLELIFIMYLAMLIGLLPALRLGKRFEKHRMLAWITAVQALANLALLLIPGGNYPALLVVWIIIGLTSAGTFFLPTSMLADIIDHGEVSEGERRSGAYVAIYNLVVKVGLALGVGLSFGLLELVHYDPSAQYYSAADMLHIRLLGFGLPCLLMVPAVILLLRHPITQTVQRRLRERIEQREPGLAYPCDSSTTPAERPRPPVEHQLPRSRINVR